MKFVCSLLALALVLGGCSSASRLLGGGSSAPASSNIQVGNNLAMPPDLQLKAPSNAPSDAYQPNTVGAGTAVQTTALNQPPAAPKPIAAAPKQDIYEQYNISKVKPDGTAKTPEELKKELKLAILKKKQETQPGYGTVRNIGNIFSDG
jgi:hypothetical protein